ncbi:dihydrofolate reductase family protein [Actinomadura harenae]|uniref:Deaminase n=1 Tax=Actinomadura harenae TaxID=2483351 RepID=A0A3M2M578_9ACTN|nr:dihydrofolate reductase family protein [Actinomadura harenae]RMI44914.1 deaminase [Actinomadura harenae]
MGKIVVSANVSLDGVVEDPTGEEGLKGRAWFRPDESPDGAAWAADELREARGIGALLLGGRTYEWFAERWPSRTGEWADLLKAAPKYVVSTTLTEFPWANATLLKGDLADGVAALRREVDGDVFVFGSGRLVRSLMENDLVDELRMKVHPVVVGTGERLFGASGVNRGLRREDTRMIGDGIVLLTYRPLRDA